MLSLLVSIIHERGIIDKYLMIMRGIEIVYMEI